MTALACAGAAQAADIPLALHLSDKARMKLISIEERVTVSVHFYGAPSPGVKVKLTEENQIYLGHEEYDLWPRDQTLHVGASAEGFPSGIVVTPMVNVNIYTSRIADANNLIDCDIVDDAISAIAGRTQKLNCKLIGE